MKQKEKITYFAYIRKSSDREDSQTLSLAAQKREIKEFAAKFPNVRIKAYFEESASAYKAGRPKFNEMLKRIEKGEANGILVYHLTRIARNSFDGGRVIYMMDEGKIREILTPTGTYRNENSDDLLMMQIHFAMAKKSSDDTSKFVKRDIESKLLKGEYPVSAPIGYLNLDKYGTITGRRFDREKQHLIEEKLGQDGRKARRIEPDPVLAPVVQELYALYASKNHSIEELTEKSYAMGVRGQRSESRITKSTMLRILTNPMYYGAIRWKDRLLEPADLPAGTRHDPIIDKGLFEQVQEILHDKSRPRKQVHSHAYRGLFFCSECGGRITSELQKGRVYYRCTKKMGTKCSQPYIREDVLEEKMEEVVRAHTIPGDFAQWALGVLSENNEDETARRKQILANQRKQVSQLEGQLENLLKMKISPNNLSGEMITDEEYVNQKTTLMKEKSTIQEKVADMEQRGDQWLERCEEFFDFASNCHSNWNTGDQAAKRNIFSLIFGSNGLICGRELVLQTEKPFFRTDSSTNDYWRGRRDSNPRPSA